MDSLECLLIELHLGTLSLSCVTSAALGAILQTFLQAALRAFGSVAWVILRPSLLEAATNIEWCLESTYGNFLINQTTKYSQLL